MKRDNIPEAEKMFEAILRTVTPELDLVVVMGDTLDRFGDIKTEPLRKAVGFLDALSRKVRTVLLIGNHDLPHKDCYPKDRHPFTALHHWGERMTVVDEAKLLEIEGYRLAFAPYVEPGKLLPMLDREIPNWKTSTAVFGHHELRGCSLGALKSHDGDIWEHDFPLAVMGHIHDYERLQENVIYVGTPMQHGYGDHPHKTVSTFTFREGHPWEEERIPLGLPRYEIVHIEASEVEYYQPPADCKLKICISGTPASNQATRKMSQIAAWRKRGIKVDFRDTRVETRVVPLSVARKQKCYGNLLGGAVREDLRLSRLYVELFSNLAPADPQVVPQPVLRLLPGMSTSK